MWPLCRCTLCHAVAMDLPVPFSPSLDAGLLRLPEITVSSVQHGQQVEVTRGCTVFVERPVEQLEAPV